MSNTSSSNDYAGYFEARNWSRNVSKENYWYYDILNKRVALRAGSRILEIGFGDSRFLDWCQARNMTAVGIEISDAAIAKAKSLGHEAYKGPLDGDSLSSDRTFDVIACFDVIEHLRIDEFRKLIKDSLPHLTDGGQYLFRLPNGNSPFVGKLFYGDITHISLWNEDTISQVVTPFGLHVSTIFNDRLLPPRGLSRLRRGIAFALRGIIETVISAAYFGSRIPLDPNIYVIVQRR